MAFEQFQTQVLLLHAKQSKLDVLSSGFNDRYTVHCATSGMEALNTLGGAPIDIIVSAQELPGMSGLDALREAKKRSPKTITILMTGADADDRLEALARERAVFQVVRGDISPEALFELVENATGRAQVATQARTAIGESVAVDSGPAPEPQNDEEETSQHIVMETAENGSFLVSESTGRVPALRPDKVGVAQTHRRQVDILVLSQDEEFLATIRESTKGTHAVHHAVKPGQAERFIRANPVGIMIADASLAGNSVEAMTRRLRTIQNRLVAIVAGRREDGEMLMDLINRGQVYRFLLKPVSPGRVRLAVEASVRHHIEAPEHSFQGRPAARKVTMPPEHQIKANVHRQEPAKTPAPASAPKKPVTAATTPRSAPARAMPSPDRDGLDDAFDEAGSLTETMTGIAVSVRKSLSNAASSLTSQAEKRVSRPTPAPNKNGPPPSNSVAVRTPPPAKPVTPPPAPKAAGRPTAKKAPDTAAITARLPVGGVRGRGPMVEPAPSMVDRLKSPVVLAGLGAAVVIAVLAVFILGGGEPAGTGSAIVDTDGQNDLAESVPEGDAQQAAPARMPEQRAAPPGPDGAIASLLGDARTAVLRGNFYSPAGTNAIELYLQALVANPGNAEIGAELDAVIDEVYALAETALLENRTQEASRALRVIGLADPGSQRLRFLGTQLDQQRLRGTLDDARVAIRASRFEEAGRLLQQAESYAGGNTSEVDALSAELAAARSDQQLDRILALGAERLAGNQLQLPANDNARYYFELAASLAPGNTAARQGLVSIASKLVLGARTAIDNGDLSGAEKLLADARMLDPDSSELADATSALLAASSSGQSPRRGESTDPQDPGTPGSVAQSSLPGDPAAEDEVAGGAKTPMPDPDVTEPLDIVSIASLNRTKYVPPLYPRAAQRRNLTGFVDVVFTVTMEGEVADIEVRESDPGDTFVRSAVDSVEQWRFDPPLEDGNPVSKRVAVRMSFNLQ